MCAICSRAPVSPATSTSRPTQMDSVCAGIPLSPRRVDCGPSRITPPAKSDGSSQWSTTSKSSERQYSITWRISRAVATGFPSSLTATIPASFMAAISARASPLLPTDAAPIGQTRTMPWAAARSTIPRVTDALSFTGSVLGMQQTAVKPPRAAERVPVSIVSDISWPGSRRWQCRSINPGATIRPLASKTSASGAEILVAIFSIRSPLRSTSCVESLPAAGLSTRPFFMSNIRSILGRIFLLVFGCGSFHGRAADEVIQKGHANRKAVGDLIEHAGLGPVGDGRINFKAANHGSGMQNEGFPICELQPLRCELVTENIFFGGDSGFMKPFGLHAQDDDGVRAGEGVFDSRDATNVGSEGFEFAGHPHRRTT